MLHLVWDMDGTLVDSTAVVPEAFTGAVAELGGPPVERDEVVAAYSLGVLEVMLAHLLGHPLQEGESEAYYRRLEGVDLEAYPETLDTLGAWRESGRELGGSDVRKCLMRQRRKPPSELSTCPTTQRPSSLTSQAINRAGSVGSPSLCCGNLSSKVGGASSR